MSQFNAYQEWLGLTPAPDTPNHYELLGLEVLEADSEVIHAAAEKAMSRVRSCRPGGHAADWSRLLDELAEAKRCLGDEQSKAAYDRRLSAGEFLNNEPTSPQPGIELVSEFEVSATAIAANAAMYPPGMSVAAPSTAADTESDDGATTDAAGSTQSHPVPRAGYAEPTPVS